MTRPGIEPLSAGNIGEHSIGQWPGYYHCMLFNAKSSLYKYIKYIRFCLFGFYGISTIVGYLMLNPFYTYILNI